MNMINFSNRLLSVPRYFFFCPDIWIRGLIYCFSMKLEKIMPKNFKFCALNPRLPLRKSRLPI